MSDKKELESEEYQSQISELLNGKNIHIVGRICSLFES
jgi:hypothetical protein